MPIKSSYETVQEHMDAPEFQERLRRDNDLSERIKAGFIPAEPTEESPKPMVDEGSLTEDGIEALENLYDAYEDLIFKLAARRYYLAGRPAAISQDDLHQEGFYGLFRAALAWDPDKNRGGFTSYVERSMWGRMNRYVENCSRNVRLPVGVRSEVNHYRAAFWGSYGAEEHIPHRKLLANVMDISVERVDRIAIAEALADQMGSIDGGYFEDDRDQHSTFTRHGEGRWRPISPSSSEMREVEEEILIHEIKEIVNNSISARDEGGRLNDREAEILRMRYFGHDGSGMTLEEVGKHFGITRERVRQIEGEVLAKLRRPGIREKLENLIKG